MRKQKDLYSWLRYPKTHNEMVANQDCELVRAKRRPKNLPNAYDDKPLQITKSWKDQRRTQYHGHGRVKKVVVVNGDNWSTVWEIKNNCKKRGMPCTVIPIVRKCRGVRIKRTKTVCVGQVPHYHIKRRYKKGLSTEIHRHQIGYRKIFEEKELDKPIVQVYNYKRTLGYKIIYWQKRVW